MRFCTELAVCVSAPTSARKTGPRGGVDRGGVDKPTEQISLALPDSTELKKGAWTVTYPNGERMKFVSDGNSEDMKPVMICVATDPDTKQVNCTLVHSLTHSFAHSLTD